jgi:type IV secretory pathway TraG/TraD family ATPase VirD4
MNPVFSYIERIAAGPEFDLMDRPLLDFGEGHKMSVRAMFESLLVVASVGKGKSTLAKTPCLALLQDNWGGLVLTVKRSQLDEFRSLAQSAGREWDVIVIAPGAAVFNPLEGEDNPSEAAALVSELAEVLAGKTRSNENESFWSAQLNIILKNLFTLCAVEHGCFDFGLVAELFDGRANSLGELADPAWQQASALAAALRTAKKRTEDINVRLAAEYFERAYPAHGDRLQGSLAATVSSVLDYLRRPPLRDLFTGKSTFTMADLLDGGRIGIVGLPVLESVDGRMANALMQFCFCRAAVRQPRQSRHNPAFLLSDECQETVSRELMAKLAVLREYKVATILLTQNMAVLDEKIGETAREGLCANLGTKIFGPQGHAATRQWASEQIGKRKVPVETRTTGSNFGEKSRGHSKSASVGEQWDYRVPPLRFAELELGETIILSDGEVWRARWHKDKPGKGDTVRIV